MFSSFIFISTTIIGYTQFGQVIMLIRHKYNKECKHYSGTQVHCFSGVYLFHIHCKLCNTLANYSNTDNTNIHTYTYMTTVHKIHQHHICAHQSGVRTWSF